MPSSPIDHPCSGDDECHKCGKEIGETPMLDEMARKINDGSAFRRGKPESGVDVTRYHQTLAVRNALRNGNWHEIVGTGGECSCGTTLDGEATRCGDTLLDNVMALVDSYRESDRASREIAGSNLH